MNENRRVLYSFFGVNDYVILSSLDLVTGTPGSPCRIAAHEAIDERFKSTLSENSPGPAPLSLTNVARLPGISNLFGRVHEPA